ncbi:HAD family hydrolase [Paenibacillus humicola]|uniref:HAD family hydrolase n=1 Tax=Paenibacillus humicola TaxID=3110540 RepID=UPI00237B4AAC|nr:HAD family hydrolase [Paenibacillus humicola]
MRLEKIRLVLFDIDDTLYDFQANWNDSVRLTFASHALTKALEQEAVQEAFHHFSVLNWQKLARGEATFGQYRFLRLKDTLDRFGVPLADEHAEDFNRQFIQAGLSLLREDAAVTSLLRRLSEKYTMGVITNGAGDTVREKLARLGLGECFPERALFVSSEIGAAKPERVIFDHALAALGFAADETVFVGDSWEADITGAWNAGLHAVWLNPKRLPLPKPFPNLYAVIEKLTELETLLLPDAGIT